MVQPPENPARDDNAQGQSQTTTDILPQNHTIFTSSHDGGREQGEMPDTTGARHTAFDTPATFAPAAQPRELRPDSHLNINNIIFPITESSTDTGTPIAEAAGDASDEPADDAEYASSDDVDASLVARSPAELHRNPTQTFLSSFNIHREPALERATPAQTPCALVRGLSGTLDSPAYRQYDAPPARLGAGRAPTTSCIHRHMADDG